MRFTRSTPPAKERLPEFARNMLANCPTAGTGVNAWLFRTARVLHAFCPPSEIADLLEANSYGCGRKVTRTEIERAVRRSENCKWEPRQQVRQQREKRWPDVNHKRIAEITAGGLGVADLWEASPIRLDESVRSTELIRDLFQADCFLCCGAAVNNMATKLRDEWLKTLDGCQFIVPSPMSKPIGLTQDGKESQRCLDNTGPRRFLVVEFDQGSADSQAAIILYLAERMPLTMALHSGGKSLHAWFYCANIPESRIQKYMRWAVALGADAATWNRCQAVRMPEATRNNGNRQTVYFYNPKGAQ